MTSGPSGRLLREPRRVDDPPPGAALGLGSLWIAVTEAGGPGGQLTLGARGGTSLPGFYRSRGWQLTGVLPAGVRLSPDDARDVHLFHRTLVGSTL